MNPFLLLLLAILSEIVGTMSLRMSHGFTRPLPSLAVLVGYGLTFYLLSLSLKQIPLSIAYAIWAGLGTAGTVVIGTFFFQETMDLWRVFGIMLILAGVFVLNMVSNAHAA
ncbi:MAG: multidrug efflux SMR transporter [Anaerolineae bacterium]|nr:multidrug efflux SMR transporter [Anaerolineae bacterium]